jgi:quercetin dioxygenase-like cupin family protein
MHVVRFSEAPPYTAPGHHNMSMVRMQGREAGPSSDLWIGVSVIAPGGGTTLSSSPEEKMYFVLDGTLHVSNGKSEVSLERWASCRIAADENRRLSNKTTLPVTVLLVMPLSADQRGEPNTDEIFEALKEPSPR